MTEPYKHPHSVASLPVVPAREEAHAPPMPASPPPASTTAAAMADASSDRPKTIEQKLLEGKIIAAISQVYDPEIPVNVYELGLIYGIDIADDNSVKIRMTLTAPGCPVAGSLPAEVGRRVEEVDGVTEAEVELVWEPAWDKSRMSEAAMLQLGF
jgi:FeS assembly SUF system protein